MPTINADRLARSRPCRRLQQEQAQTPQRPAPPPPDPVAVQPDPHGPVPVVDAPQGDPGQAKNRLNLLPTSMAASTTASSTTSPSILAQGAATMPPCFDAIGHIAEQKYNPRPARSCRRACKDLTITWAGSDRNRQSHRPAHSAGNRGEDRSGSANRAQGRACGPGGAVEHRRLEAVRRHGSGSGAGRRQTSGRGHPVGGAADVQKVRRSTSLAARCRGRRARTTTCAPPSSPPGNGSRPMPPRMTRSGKRSRPSGSA